MAVPNPHIRFRYEDYQTLPESMTARYELLDGDLLMVPAPTVAHQRISRKLASLLDQFVEAHDLGEMFYSPIDVVLGMGDDREVVQPDLIFIEKARRHIITEKEIQGAPVLVVEILSPGTAARDRSYKKILYGRYGVREYWIVDPGTRTVEVYAPTAAGLKKIATCSHRDVLTSEVLPGLRIALVEVFK